MRPLLTVFTFLVGLCAAPAAWADCIGPGECFCARTSSTGPFAVALVRSTARQDGQTLAELELESVHGTAQTTWTAGARVDAAVWQELEVGVRVVVEPADQGAGVNAFSLVQERADGSVACSGFSSEDLTVTDVLESRLAEDCYSAIYAGSPTFDSPPCNDVVTGPFNCRAGPGAQDGVWAAVVVVGFKLRRRRLRG